MKKKIVAGTAVFVFFIVMIIVVLYNDKKNQQEADRIIGNTIRYALLQDDSSTVESNGEVDLEFIGAFEKAEYNKYNSYASENGLGDTLIYIEGKVLNQTVFDDSDSGIPTLALVIEQEDGNRWCVCVTSDSKIKEIEGKNVQIFGTYMGFSDVINLPSMAVFVDDIEKIDEARIDLEENGEYVTVWRFSDYLEEEISNQEENTETEEISGEEQSQESIEVYVPTTGEKNALRSAKDYLELMAFSYQGLVEQLEYEKYSHDEAVYAADNCGADWNEQAAKSAKDYLELMSFSKDGLIEQLEYEGFTHEQAVYGVEENGY